MSPADAADAWLSSTVTLYETSIKWNSKCPASDFNISASLCWRRHAHLCTSTLETSLKVEKGEQLLVRSSWCCHRLMDDSNFRTHCACPQQSYSISEVDKHPLMCVQVRKRQMFMDSNMHSFHPHVHISFVFKFSLGGSHQVDCPFQGGESKGGHLLLFCLYCLCFPFQPFCLFCADTSSWEVYLGPGGQSVFLYLTSSTPATFSAQMCVLEERRCTPVGEIHSVTVVSARLYSRGQIMYKGIK